MDDPSPSDVPPSRVLVADFAGVKATSDRSPGTTAVSSAAANAPKSVKDNANAGTAKSTTAVVAPPR
jgi:hypothetical protein